ncbi:Bactoprenol glucosyl transferase [Thiorhodovibrio winogradskyi]|uniref:Bactoprenol glucosyl transferase n=1 Tax=Thiorhodovibrio winogradskyi TaxID=77007 RepID=A0ABZ0S4V3_9GAMM|nr:glycosyltransferase family 2 protein [Thiorhodovibrio winogradskyi]
MPPDLTILVPVLNEADSIRPFLAGLDAALEQETSAGLRLEILFINDGSRDTTLERLLEIQQVDTRLRIIDLSRNFGKEAALAAGLQRAGGRAVVPMDVDLQDPPGLIPDMLSQWRAGAEMVLARRRDRSTDSWSKRLSARWFYRLHNAISEIEIPDNVGDFRLLDRRVVDAINELPESCRFTKGLFAWVGFRTVVIDYVRAPRAVGTSKFSGWRLWNFALEGITSFSTVPLRIWTYLGFAVAAGAFLYGFLITLLVLLRGVDVPGYASLIVLMAILGGLQLAGIGILGEYLGRAYLETKHRPVCIVREVHEPRDSHV